MLEQSALRVVVAEDSAVVRAGLVEILADRGHEIVAAVGDADALRTAVEDHQPDVAVVDVRMPPGFTDEGLQAAIAIRRDHPAVGVLVFSQYVETTYAAELLGVGPRGSTSGVGYLLKDRVADVREFTDALATVAAGGTALDPEVVSHLLAATMQVRALATLTGRERDVLGLMAEGRSNNAIARNLVISERAVEKNVSNIFTKLGLPPSDADHRRVLAVLRYLRALPSSSVTGKHLPQLVEGCVTLRIEAAVDQADERLRGQAYLRQVRFVAVGRERDVLAGLEDEVPFGVAGRHEQLALLPVRLARPGHQRAEHVDEQGDGVRRDGRRRVEGDRDVPGVHRVLAQAHLGNTGKVEVHAERLQSQPGPFVLAEGLEAFERRLVGAQAVRHLRSRFPLVP
jgi:DNA-binding NarL/FixJ family response regulator